MLEAAVRSGFAGVPAGAVDCDVHPAVPGLDALLPHFEPHWRALVQMRGMDELQSAAYPPNAPLTMRADWRAEAGQETPLARLQADCLDPFGSAIAICNCLYGVQMLFGEDMAAGYCRALNRWMAQELLDRDHRLRASILVPVQNVELAVDEIERCAPDRRFVQVLLLAGGDHPLGRRLYWPIYAAAERHGLAIGIHAGSSYHNPPTSVGWPTYLTEDYAAQAPAFQSQLTSLICEGVFERHPGLKVVLLESGWTWLPAHLWRLTKYWRGLRMEIPWVERPPLEIVRDHVRLSLQPTDAPPDGAAVERLVEHLQSDALLLFATDYPHWQFDGMDALPRGLSPSLARRIMLDNPRETYARLEEIVA